MSQKRIIVILTQTVDPHVEPVAEVLRRHDARMVRFDLQDFPTNIQLAAKIAPEYSWQGSLLYNGQAIALEDLAGVSACAHLFQERIAKAMDLRVVVIGRQIFTIGIHAHSQQAALDWRRSYGDLSYSVETLPEEIEQKLLQFVRLFGLQYSSMDLILSPEGEYVWLEANPNGQFLWMASPTSLPMAEAMANLLYRPEEYGLW